MLPHGQAYIFGGTAGEGLERANGSESYDFASNTTNVLPVNQPLLDATKGGYYPDMFVLPTGALAIMSGQVIQVLNYTSGQALASTPSFAGTRAEGLYWEYPYMATTVVLPTGVLAPNKETRIEFVAFGGNFPSKNPAPTTPCADISVRIGLNISADGRHTFDEAWEIEDMPTSRCVANAVLLPNGHVVIIEGAEQGFGGLSANNLANEPADEPWIYQPTAPAGRRYTKTGTTSNIARLYHSSALLTSDGEILLTGTSTGKGFGASNKDFYDLTPYNESEYRVQIFTPSYIPPLNVNSGDGSVAKYDGSSDSGSADSSSSGATAQRPSIFYSPTMIEYGTSFNMAVERLPYNGAGATVLLMDPGSNTHSLTMGRRAQALAFAVRGKVKGMTGMLSLAVEAPATPDCAPPGFYLLWVVPSDGSGSYSVGSWVLLRHPAPARLPTLPEGSMLHGTLSTAFEPRANSGSGRGRGSRGQGGSRGTLWTGRTKANTVAFDLSSDVPACMGTGSGGALIMVGGNSTQETDVQLAGPSVELLASTVHYTELWASAGKDTDISFAWEYANGTLVDGSRTTLHITPQWQLFNLQPFRPAADEKLTPVINLGSVSASNTVCVDDIRVYVSETDTRSVPTFRSSAELTQALGPVEPVPGVELPVLTAPDKPESLRNVVFYA